MGFGLLMQLRAFLGVGGPGGMQFRSRPVFVALRRGLPAETAGRAGCLWDTAPDCAEFWAARGHDGRGVELRMSLRAIREFSADAAPRYDSRRKLL